MTPKQKAALDKELAACEFDALVEKACADILFGLMQDGGRGFRNAVYRQLFHSVDRHAYYRRRTEK